MFNILEISILGVHHPGEILVSHTVQSDHHAMMISWHSL